MTSLPDQGLFLGRQAILDVEQKLFAYELLFRNGKANEALVTDGVQATATVIANAFTELGVESALGKALGFINVDEDFLFSDVLELLPKETVVLEILETVRPTAQVIERCKVLKANGFTLALDDVIQIQPEFAALISLVEIIKVDIQPLTEAELISLATQLRPLNKRLLAEKVDNQAQKVLCQSLGFTLFQGYYFAKPTIIAGKKIEHSQLTLMKLMGLLFADADTGEIEKLLKPEPALTVNLLRLTNSVGSGVHQTITSLKHAITVLGRRQLQRWLQLLVFTTSKESGSSNPLLQMAATRGRQLELLAQQIRPKDILFADQAFMVGIMSLMPAAIGLPIEEIIAPLGLSENVSIALRSQEGELGQLFSIVKCCDEGLTAPLDELLNTFPSLNAQTLNEAQTQALIWAQTLSQEKHGD